MFITGPILQLVDLVSEDIIRPVVNVSVLTLCIIYLRVYHWVDTSPGRLLVPEGIIRPVVSVSVLTRVLDIYVFITGSIPQLVDYWSPRASSAQ